MAPVLSDINIFLVISGILAFTLFFGKLVEKIRVPWVFSALFLGLLLSIYNPVPSILSSPTFDFLSDLGIYFLLFIIGLELDVEELLHQGAFITRLSTVLVVTESILGALALHFLFGLSWGIAVLTASSFATVGEAVLLPILDEFDITHTFFGQSILGVGILDDVVELVTIIVSSVVLGFSVGDSHWEISSNFAFLILLFLMPLASFIFRSQIPSLRFKRIPALFLFGLVVLFAFVGIGSFVESSALGAIFAGIALKNILSKSRVEQFEHITRTVAYGFFVPVFFLNVGSEVDLSYLKSYPLFIVLVLFLTLSSKILVSACLAFKRMGIKKAVLMGIGLSAKFSTSIVIISMLYGHHLISSSIYSVLIGAMILSKFIIPVSFSVLLKKWSLQFSKV